MKKLMAIMLMAFVLVFGFTACGDDASKDSENTEKETTLEDDAKDEDSEEDSEVNHDGEKELVEDEVKDPKEVTKVNSDEAKALINDEGAVLVDVRTLDEYNDSHIENSISIPLDELDSLIEEQIKDKNTKIIVYCRSGRRSAIAGELLVDAGYTAVYDLGAKDSWED